MGMAYVRIFFDWLEATAELSHEEKGRLIDAVVRYAREGELVELPGNERFVFPSFLPKLDRDAEKYRKLCERGPRVYARAPLRDQESRDDESRDKELREQESREQESREHEPTVLKNNNNWRTSARARGAVAQMIVDAALNEELGCAQNNNLHELLVEAMEQGLTPEALMDLCRRSNDMPLGALLYEALQSRGLNAR